MRLPRPRPCRGPRRDSTFDNILKREVPFPRGGVSAEAKDLIQRLLVKVGPFSLVADLNIHIPGLVAKTHEMGCKHEVGGPQHLPHRRLTAPPPPSLPPPAQDPAQRLGAQAGADEVKQHPWFAEVNWAVLGRSQRHLSAKLQAAGSSVSVAANGSSAGRPRSGTGSGPTPGTPKKAEGVSMGCFSRRKRRS